MLDMALPVFLVGVSFFAGYLFGRSRLPTSEEVVRISIMQTILLRAVDDVVTDETRESILERADEIVAEHKLPLDRDMGSGPL